MIPTDHGTLPWRAQQCLVSGASVRRLRDRIVHTHIEDMRKGEHLHLLPGQGEIDLVKIFAALSGIGYKGALALDIYVSDYEKEAPGCAGMIQKLLKDAGI